MRWLRVSRLYANCSASSGAVALARSRTTRSSCARRSGASAPRRARLRLVAAERGRAGPDACVERARERDRVLDRELGARADREVRGVRRVADQHDGTRRRRACGRSAPCGPLARTLAGCPSSGSTGGRRRAETGSRSPSRAGARRWSAARGRRATARTAARRTRSPSSWLIASRPAACHVSSGVSTMNVDVSPSNGRRAPGTSRAASRRTRT